MTDLQNSMKQASRDGETLIDHSAGMCAEVVDVRTGLIWMTVEPLTPEEFANLKLGDDYKPVAIASAAMDVAVFHSSPDRRGESVLERVIDDRRFINVAIPTPVSMPDKPNGFLEMSVNKSHSLGFAKGRTLTVLSLPEGDFVEVVGDSGNDDNLVLPGGAVLKTITLETPWIVKLPEPTRAFFWFPSMRSFQGPVTLPEE